MLHTFLAGIPSPMHRAKARAALETMVRVNGAHTLQPRHLVIEGRVAAGSRVVDQRGDLVLMRPDGAFFDARNITKHGLSYAAWLEVHAKRGV